MNRTLLAVLLAAAPAAASGPLAADYDAALKAVQTQARETRRAAAEANPCLQDRQLDRTGFRLTLDGKAGAVLDARFKFESCYVVDRDADSDPVTPAARRVYGSEKTGYKLTVRVERGSGRAEVSLTIRIGG